MHLESLSTQKLSLKQTFHDQNRNTFNHIFRKLPPLPLFRKDPLNSCKTRKRFRLEGHKYFAKLSASGPETAKILKSIKKPISIKFLRSFEFDPYLCDKSHINDLRKICPRIKEARRTNFVIRRVNTSDELETLSPFIARFLRVISFRIEFPNTQNVGEKGLLQLHKAIRNFSFLQSFERVDANMPERSEQYRIKESKYTHQHPDLESIKYYGIVQKGTLRNEIIDQKQTPKIYKFPRIKFLDATFSVPGEWANMGIENDLNEQLTKSFDGFPQLQVLRLKLIKTMSNYHEILNILTAVSTLQNIHHLDFEYLNCRISDMEVIAFVQGIVKITQLKSFRLKVIQNFDISEDCIEKVAGVLSRLDNLTKFDLYFRKLSLHPRAIVELGKRIEGFGNISCSCSKESIYIYKRNRE